MGTQYSLSLGSECRRHSTSHLNNPRARQGSREPGDDARAPYQREQFFATNLERLLAAELGVEWFAYDRLVEGLGVKK